MGRGGGVVKTSCFRNLPTGCWSPVLFIDQIEVSWALWQGLDCNSIHTIDTGWSNLIPPPPHPPPPPHYSARISVWNFDKVVFTTWYAIKMSLGKCCKSSRISLGLVRIPWPKECRKINNHFVCYSNIQGLGQVRACVCWWRDKASGTGLLCSSMVIKESE